MKLLTMVVLVLMCGFAFAEPAKPFAPSQVRLGDGIFKDSMKVKKVEYVRLTVLPRPELEGNAARPKIDEIKVFGQLE
jgi:hypothetical protein